MHCVEDRGVNRGLEQWGSGVQVRAAENGAKQVEVVRTTYVSNGVAGSRPHREFLLQSTWNHPSLHGWVL